MNNQLVWFRNDLRVADHQALTQAAENATTSNSQCFAVYLWSENQLVQQGAGGNRFCATEQALNGLNDSLANIGIRLVVLTIQSWADAAHTIKTFVREHHISHVHCHFEPGYDEYHRDKAVKASLPESVKFVRYNDLFLVHPSQNLNKQQEFYRVFTAFKKATLQKLDTQLTSPMPVPTFNPPVSASPIRLSLTTQWANPLALATTEGTAHDRLEQFLQDEPHYQAQRDIPSIDGTSKLSVALSLGLLTSRQIVWALMQTPGDFKSSTYFSEILWREFYKYLTYYRMDLCQGKPFNEKWDQIAWVADDEKLGKWQQGKTGVPIVDAAMRQLNSTGWMHNRLRMVSAMYLSKLLRINWRAGEKYFASQLADWDFSANNGGWQWVSSTGVDAVPYFRIFNPYEQSKRFDPEGKFIRKYVPELAGLSNKDIHLIDHSKTPVDDYPTALIDYKTARNETLTLFKAL